jgi:replicative DNA helicase
MTATEEIANCPCGREVGCDQDGYFCRGCDKAPGACVCDRPDTLLARLLPGGCILDVPAVPESVWGDGADILWAAGQALIIAGPDGVGKTTLAGNLIAARLGLGGEVLGLPVKPGERNVLVLLMDRPQQAMAALARLFTDGDRDTLDTRLRIWRGPPPQDLARNTAMLGQLCMLAGADTCVIDSLKDAALKLTDDEAGSGWNRARQLAIEAGTELVELHHPRKGQDGNRKPSKLDDLYGSRWISAGAGSVVSLWGQAGDPIVELTHLKPAVETVGPWTVGIDSVTGRVSVTHGVDLLEQVRLRGSNGITAAQAAQLLYGNETPASTEKARRRLNKKVTEGLLICLNGKAGGVHGGVHATYFPAAFTEPFTERSRPGESVHALTGADRSRVPPHVKWEEP